MISQRRESLMVKFQASGEAVLGSRDQIPCRAVTLTLSPRGSHTLSPGPLADVRKGSVSVTGIWVRRVELAVLSPHTTVKEAQKG